MAPVLACAVCPACLGTYAKILAIVGFGLAVSERQHLLLLVAAIAASLAVNGYRSWRTRRLWPVLVAAVGCSLIVSGHVAGDVAALEWFGIATLILGSWLDRRATAAASSG